MYDHVGLRVKDLAASQRFYTAALGALGHALNSSGDDYAGFGAGPSTFWLHKSDAAPAKGAHVCFMPPASPPADATTARRDPARSTAPATTLRS
jgi:catechol 2,3-dioxygenase-like lactoylglutathione lyase family enzyme